MVLRVDRYFFHLLATACLSAAITQDVRAADVAYPLKSAPLIQIPQSWAGLYVGGQLGYGTDAVGWRNLGVSSLFSPPNSLTRDRGGGAVGGGQVGYNFQFNRLVLGVEGSVSAADFDRSFTTRQLSPEMKRVRTTRSEQLNARFVTGSHNSSQRTAWRAEQVSSIATRMRTA